MARLETYELEHDEPERIDPDFRHDNEWDN